MPLSVAERNARFRAKHAETYNVKRRVTALTEERRLQIRLLERLRRARKRHHEPSTGPCVPNEDPPEVPCVPNEDPSEVPCVPNEDPHESYNLHLPTRLTGCAKSDEVINRAWAFQFC